MTYRRIGAGALARDPPTTLRNGAETEAAPPTHQLSWRVPLIRIDLFRAQKIVLDTRKPVP